MLWTSYLLHSPTRLPMPVLDWLCFPELSLCHPSSEKVVVQPTDREDGVSSQGWLLLCVCSVWGEMKRSLTEVWLSALLMLAIWRERGRRGHRKRARERERRREGRGEIRRNSQPTEKVCFEHSKAPNHSPPREFHTRTKSHSKATLLSNPCSRVLETRRREMLCDLDGKAMLQKNPNKTNRQTRAAKIQSQ